MIEVNGTKQQIIDWYMTYYNYERICELRDDAGCYAINYYL